MASENREDRLQVKCYLNGALILTADLSPEMTVGQLEEWANRMQARGCVCCFKRVPWPSDEDPLGPATGAINGMVLGSISILWLVVILGLCCVRGGGL